MAPTPGELVQLDCPICMSLLTDPFVTPCGHTFCYGCISTHLQAGKNCPSCQRYLTKDLIYPNFLLSKVGCRWVVGVKPTVPCLRWRCDEEMWAAAPTLPKLHVFSAPADYSACS